MSILTIPNNYPLLNSLEELSTSSLSPLIWQGSDLDSLFTVKSSNESIFCLLFSSLIKIINYLTQQAKEGVYHSIGDRLRKRPELLIKNIEDGPPQVLNGSYAYMNVSGRYYSNYSLHKIDSNDAITSQNPIWNL